MAKFGLSTPEGVQGKEGDPPHSLSLSLSQIFPCPRTGVWAFLGGQGPAHFGRGDSQSGFSCGSVSVPRRCTDSGKGSSWLPWVETDCVNGAEARTRTEASNG